MDRIPLLRLAVYVAGAVVAVATAAPGHAGVYVYQAADGTMHFSDSPKHKGYQPYLNGRSSSRDGAKSEPWGRQQVRDLIYRLAGQYRLDPVLVDAVVRVESYYNPAAVSHKGAMGLMQLMPKTADMLGVGEPFDPLQNLAGGMKYLRYLLDRFKGKLDWALAAYHAGEGRVSRAEGIPNITSTQSYVKRVLGFYQEGRAGAH